MYVLRVYNNGLAVDTATTEDIWAARAWIKDFCRDNDVEIDDFCFLFDAVDEINTLIDPTIRVTIDESRHLSINPDKYPFIVGCTPMEDREAVEYIGEEEIRNGRDLARAIDNGDVQGIKVMYRCSYRGGELEKFIYASSKDEAINAVSEWNHHLDMWEANPVWV